MKMMIVASALIVAGTSNAFAADAVVYQEGAAAYNWSGLYTGIALGYARGDSPFENRTNDYVERTAYDPDGVFGGLYVGYDHQMNSGVVLGVDADINVSNLTGGGEAYTWSDANGSGELEVETSSKMNWNGAVRARIGYAYDRFLPYIAGGISFGQYEFEMVVNNHIAFSEKAVMTGWNVGAGVDYAATDNLILRAEYRFTDFGSKTYHDLWGEDTGKVKLRTHDVRLGVAYKF